MRQVWEAADEVAHAFAASPGTTTFRGGLKPIPADPNAPPFQRRSVSEILVTYSTFQSQPLLLGVRLAHVPEFGELHSRDEAVREWFAVAERFAFALVTAVEFLRSRLPGYPRLLVPDVLPSTPRVRNDGFWDQRFPWMLGPRSAGLQFQSVPDLSTPLELVDGGRRMRNALAGLLDALQASEVWRRFDEAHAACTASDWERAKELRAHYRKLTTDEWLNAIGGTTGLRRQQALRGELAATRARAEGALAEYIRAWDAVDEVLEAIAALINDRVARGDVPELPLFAADWGPPRALRYVRLDAASDEFFKPMRLVRIPSSFDALAGLVLLHSLTVFIDEGALVADGRLLTGSSGLPSAGPTA
jgi:hypothetical protein